VIRYFIRRVDDGTAHSLARVGDGVAEWCQRRTAVARSTAPLLSGVRLYMNLGRGGSVGAAAFATGPSRRVRTVSH